jgi:2-oxoglutarate ferredoxin oxidoreductase subunit alpha
MEDEIASMGAVIGASAGGVKAMTATSGPGFSLKQENLGYAALTEIPCVIVNVMRGGPSTGMPTRPAQGDIMQARWGTHGDHPTLVLAPWSVEEVYAETIRAFNLAELLRTPVIILFDETIGHLVETVDLTHFLDLEITDRKWADSKTKGFKPYADPGDGIPVMARPGDGHRVHTTGLTHGENGFPTQDAELVAQFMSRLLGKIEKHRDEVEHIDVRHCDDADVVIVAYGITARAAHRAVGMLREQGVRAGLFRPLTLWPFPEAAFKAATGHADLVLVPEMNAGQLILEVERLVSEKTRVAGVNIFFGDPITPQQIVEKAEVELNDE